MIVVASYWKHSGDSSELTSTYVLVGSNESWTILDLSAVSTKFLPKGIHLDKKNWKFMWMV